MFFHCVHVQLEFCFHFQVIYVRFSAFNFYVVIIGDFL